MRRENAKAGCVCVSIRDNGFHTRSHQRSLLVPTDITGEIFTVAMELFSQLWDGETPLRLLGIALTDLDRGAYMQQSLFEDGSRERKMKVDQAVDALRGRFGTDVISRASAVKTRR